MANLTPMMQQYLKIHEQVPDAILFFRLGDFYEMFFDDAVTASKLLDITLTGKDCGLDERAPMCGVPYHAVDVYIAKLVDKGYKIAICEQVSDPKDSKGIVDREIVRIITSGTVTDGKALKENDNNYLMSVYYNKLQYGIAYTDVSTGETYACALEGENADADFLNLLNVITPSEILINTVLYQHNEIRNLGEVICKTAFTPFPIKYYNYENCVQEITRQLNVYSLNATGIDKNEAVIKACGALFSYLRETQKTALKHINKILIFDNNTIMHLDYATKKNLELTETIRSQEKKGSLLWVLDKTVTSSGARTLKQWINEPLLNKKMIGERHDVLSEMTADIMLIEDIQFFLKNISDIQRLCSKISYATVNGKELLALKETAFLMPKIKLLLRNAFSGLLIEIRDNLDDLSDIAQLIEDSINLECPVSIKDGDLIKQGYSKEADELRNLKNNAKEILASIELKEKEKSGIKNLKIKYNKVFGYYFEITNSNLESVPDHFIRKQTLVNAERFYTQELKEIEVKLLSAHEELSRLEFALFNEVVDTIASQMQRLQNTAKYIGILDALCSLSIVSYKNKYVRPYLNDEGKIHLTGGRHPVIEAMTNREFFIPNDMHLDNDLNRMSIITGPNMAGKSTYIRQAAVISLMCQIGCFVPCEEADMCIVDRIFTRVGASDDLASGQSTFMVEMSEVSNILKYATKNSLVILDEVGRGTSTFDGLSIAWAVAEFLSDKEILGCKTLFATHYHELTELESIDGIVNYSISIKQTDDGVIFLHKIKQGCADKSYGIEVAKLAGLPNIVVERAEEILELLEENEEKNKKNKEKKKKTVSIYTEANEINLLNYKNQTVLEEIKKLPINEMTPVEVMNYIAKLQNELKE